MLNAVIVQAASGLVHCVYNGITPGISKELQEPNKTKIVKMALIWFAKHKEMQRNKGHAVYSVYLTERENLSKVPANRLSLCCHKFSLPVCLVSRRWKRRKSRVPTGLEA